MEPKSKFSEIKQRLAAPLGKLKIDGQTVLLLGVLMVLVVFFGVTEEKFLMGRTITSMGFQLPEIGILALSMMLAILTGGINLSINATSNLAAVLSGLFLVRVIPKDVAPDQVGFYLLIALLIALGIGLLCGAINGFLIGYVGVPPILATLASMTFFTGISTGITGGKTVTGFPDQLSLIGSKALFGVPIPFLILVAIAIVTYLILFQTAFGFKVRMVGSNPTAANFSGINNPSIIMKVYVISGIYAAIAGVLVMSRTMSAAIEYGATTYVLLTILISVLAYIIPGFGSVLNIFIAVLILQVISTGFHMFLLGVRGSSFFKDFTWGILMIFIFVINYFTRGRKAEES
ncbi:MAG: ABC transporter permease [Chloroflexi bacterium]|nr:ABC transporter permease [Chloroflexota bacterium]